MSLPDVLPIASYSGNASTSTAYPFPFKVLAASHVKLYIDGVLSTDAITVTGVGDEAGVEVTTSVAYRSASDPLGGQQVTLRREVPFSQETDLVEGGRLREESLENALDYGVMQAQQLKEELGRAVKFPPGSSGSTLPSSTNSTIGQDANGDLVSRTAQEELDHLGVGTAATEASASAAAAATSETNAATSETNSGTSETNAAASAAAAEASNVNASTTLGDLSSKSFPVYRVGKTIFAADITSDLTMNFPGGGSLTLKTSERPYTEANATNANDPGGANVTDYITDIINIINGDVRDHDTSEDSGLSGWTASGNAITTVSNATPITGWSAKLATDGGVDIPGVMDLTYYGSDNTPLTVPLPLEIRASTESSPPELPYVSYHAAQTLTESQKTQARDNIGIQDSADGTSFSEVAPMMVKAGLGTPFKDPDVESVLTATSTTDDLGVNHYRRLITGLKDLGIWSKLESGFLFGDNHQSSSTTLQPIKGSNTATGSGTNNDYDVSLNGTSNGYLVSNANADTAAAGRALVTIYTHDEGTGPNALLSNYEGGSNRGMVMTVAGLPIGGAIIPTYADNLFGLGSVDGSAVTAMPDVEAANDGQWSFGALSLDDGNLTIMGNSREVETLPLSTVWVDRPNWGIGKNPNSSYFHTGRIATSLIFKEGLSNGELFNLRLLLESILADVIDFQPCIVWEGNSLTAQNSGGGTPLANKVMANAAWDDVRFEVLATGGAKQTQRVEAQYYNQARRWVAAGKAKRIFWLWSGINDITALISSSDIIASLKRQLLAAREDGFFTILVPLTPVASAGDGTTYTYSAAQQTTLTEVNEWIADEGAKIADQYLDINLLADTYPAFGDPTDSTYYTAGDGLHHNDTGRNLMRDYIVANVEVPTI